MDMPRATVLILTPMKTAGRHLAGYFAGLEALTYPSDLLSLAGEQWVGSVVSCSLRPQFRDTDQVEGRATEDEQPVHLRQATQFHLL